ncbi:MAG: rRNA pseudouridine synthase [Actinobacteria bacterium]|nr:rRNA pseudouridine synthase [Actinomycetota bacterium]
MAPSDSGHRSSRRGPQPAAEGVRLQKVLAAAGVGSRRYAEVLIDAGRVTVDGEVVRGQGMRVDPESAVIHVDGVRVPTAAGAAVYMLNKPVGVHSTMSDPQGRPCVGDLVGGLDQRVFHVGRLDAATSGLLLLTNDGELANRLTHPSHGVAKTYLAEVAGPIKPATLGRLRAGVELDGRVVEVESIRVVSTNGAKVHLELVIHEGRKHVVRRLLQSVGHPVSGLVRTQVGPLHLGGLKPGKLRRLSREELGALYTAVGM